METQNLRLSTADKIIQHMESEFPVATLWLFSALKHYLLVSDETTLADFKKRLERLCPDTMEAFVKIAKSKENMKCYDEYSPKMPQSQIEKMKSFYDAARKRTS